MENNIRTVDRRRFKYIAFLVLVITVVTVIILLGERFVLHSPQTPRVTPDFPRRISSSPGLMENGRLEGLQRQGSLPQHLGHGSHVPGEMPSMERLYQELKGKDFEILAISIDASGANAVAPFMRKYGLSFALLDPQGTIRGLYGVTGVPESFIIGKEGIIEK